MIDADGAPKVIEFNVRFGDPETQPVMMRLRSDLVALVEAAIDGELGNVEADWDPRPALGVVMAAEGYPAEPRTGDRIDTGDPTHRGDTRVFHAGTRLVDGHALTSGGRVLCVCALGDTVAAARDLAYSRLAGISWPGEFHRHDIGHRAIAREQRGR
jgi:phosphoribosylamine--glycine ligase